MGVCNFCNNKALEQELVFKDPAEYNQLSTEIERIATLLEMEKEHSNEEEGLEIQKYNPTIKLGTFLNQFESMVYRFNGKTLQARWCIIENNYLSFFASKFSHLINQEPLLLIKLEDIKHVKTYQDASLYFFEVASKYSKEIFAVKDRKLWDKWTQEFQQTLQVIPVK